MDQLVIILFYLGAVQGILLSAFLFSIKVNKISNRLLGLLTLFWSIILIQFALHAQGYYPIYPHLYKTFSNLILTLFPLQYLYVKYLLYDLKKFRKTDLLHFAPAIINILIAYDFYFLSGPEKLEWIRNKSSFYEIVEIITNEVIAAQGIVYSILIFVRLAKYKREIENYESNVDKVILFALYRGTILILISWVIGTVAVNLEYFNIPLQVDLFIYVYLIIVLVIYITSFVAIKTPELFKLDESEMRVILLKGQNDKIENLNSAIKSIEENKPELDTLDHELISLMENEKPFLEPDLNLLELAEKVNLSRNQLSYIINQNHQKNFNEFVNSYRVEEVKRLMFDPANKNLKLISIAYDSGFNSKASFNRIFKQMTNMTPSQFFSMQEEV
jgi:AraC-like DNA-binding protein